VENSQSKINVEQLGSLTAQNLLDLRDSLVDLSLALQELLFDVDATARSRAEQETDEILCKTRRIE